ncbi:unnamed protein product [Dicrocoelium dendriticum]|nr:unnamed protein product [Dicrocoelium dendriticum]
MVSGIPGTGRIICVLFCICLNCSICHGLNCVKFINALAQQVTVDYPKDNYALTCFGNKCLLHVYLERTFKEAKNMCKQMTGHLWVPPANETFPYDRWVGIKGVPVDRSTLEMAWITDDMCVPEKFNWDEMEPELHARAQCVVSKTAANGRWVTKNCARKFFFTCVFEFP